jgi:Ca-activated chloride channel family protein
VNLHELHFLRPAWLFALALLIPLLGFAWRRRASSGWERVCEPHLLRHILTGVGAKRARGWLAAFAIGWIGACLALAGPSWERMPQPAFADPARTVFVVGLAASMDARDVAPSRMARARYKLKDLVDRVGAGSAALVVYREEAFEASPLTDDLNVLRELTPLLETNLAPGRRVLPARGIEEAVRLLEPTGVTGAQIVLVTDGSDDDPAATRAAAAAAARGGARVSVLGIAGASAALEAIAAAGHGTFAALSADDRDVAQLLAARDPGFGTPLSKSEHQADTWRDMGVWLVWVPLLLAPLAFRRGWVTALLALLCLQLVPEPTRAGVLDWFERPDQRAAHEFAQEHYDAAAKTFEDPAWRAAAQYRAGAFDAAASALAGRADPDSSYNRANALARAGKLEDALAGYDAALAARPDDADAQFNRDLVKRLLDQQTAASRDAASEGGDSGKRKDASDPSSGDASAAKNSGATPEAAAQPGAGAQGDASAQPGASDPGEPSSEATGQDASDSKPRADAGTSMAPKAADSKQGAQARAEQAAADAQRGADARDSAERAEQGSPDAASADGAATDGSAESEPQQAADTADGSAPDGPAREAAGANLLPPPVGAAQQRGRASLAGPGTAQMSRAERQTARWMARLPDDPGGLLREKIRRDYARKLAARQQGDRP